MANQTAHQEIDLSQVSRKMKSYLSRTNDMIFDSILFIKRNIIMLVLLVAIGAVLGYLKDEQSTLYAHKVDVIANFGSIDYLDGQIAEINSRLAQRDSAFVQKHGLEGIVLLELEPNVDLFGFLNDPGGSKPDNDRNYQIFKIMAENGDLAQLLEDRTLTRNYKTHKLIVYTVVPIKKDEVVKPLLDYLNSDPYYVGLQKAAQENLANRMKANDSLIGQIDAILNNFATNPSRNTSLMYYNEDTELNVIESKIRLIKEQDLNNILKYNTNTIIKETGVALNIATRKGLAGKMKFIIPFLFIIVFVCAVQFRNFYRKQANKRKIIVTNE